MKQLNSEQKILYNIRKTSIEKNKNDTLIFETFQLTKNQNFEKLSEIKIAIDAQYITSKLLLNNTLIIITSSCIYLYQNILKDNLKYLSTKIQFNYDRQNPIKIYQMHSNNQKFIISNGKLVLLLEKHNNKLVAKTYNKLNNMNILKVINDTEQYDKFSGNLTRIQCLINYENNNTNMKNNINIQSLILPQFENDIIIDFELIYFNIDDYSLYQIYNQNLIIYSNQNKINYFIINDNKKNQKLQISDDNTVIDDIICKNNYLFIFCDNKSIYLYEITETKNKEYSFQLKNKIQYNNKNNIFIKRKIFLDNKDKNIYYVYCVDYLNKKYIFNFNNNTQNISINNETEINNLNNIESEKNYILSKINKIQVYYINNKHCVLLNTSFYNKKIINLKLFSSIKNNYIMLLTNYSIIEIYSYIRETGIIENLLFNIHLEHEFPTVIDFVMINGYYLLLLNFNPIKNNIELLKISLCYTCNEKERKMILFEKDMAYNNLYHLKELNLLFINSNYGEIAVYNIDSEANIDYIMKFNYGFSSNEIINIKNNLSLEDYSKLFIYDLMSKKLKTFFLIDIFFIEKYKENELYNFHLVIFLYKDFFLLVIVLENKYTLIKKILFEKQITFNKEMIANKKERNDNIFEYILNNLTYDVNNASFDFTNQKNE